MHAHVRVNNFNELDKFLEDLGDISMAFRGHSDSAWRLQSKFDRLVAQLRKPTQKEKQQREENFTKHFEFYRELVCTLLDVRALDDSQLESLGQHNGLATRLLDWTLSPYMAVFFAMSDMKESKVPCLWCLDIDAPAVRTDKSESTAELQIVRPQFHNNARIVAQQGLFTQLYGGGALESLTAEQLSKLSRGSCVSLQRVDLAFSSEEWERCRSRLGRMGITSASMYPDLIGIAQATNQRSERRKGMTIAPENFPNLRRLLDGAAETPVKEVNREALEKFRQNVSLLGVNPGIQTLAAAFIEQQSAPLARAVQNIVDAQSHGWAERLSQVNGMPVPPAEIPTNEHRASEKG